jgi:predicted O-methyltransferase YrrM
MIDIYLRNQPPPIETFDHISFISFLADWIRPEHYLELGVRSGINFKVISSKSIKSAAVDLSPILFDLPENSNFYLGSTDDYFNSLDNNEKFDLIFIDADHSHDQSLKDFINSQKFLIDDGFIILHDTYPINESFLDPTLCNDSYKTALYIKNNLSDSFEILTLPFHPGLTLIKKCNKNRQLIWKY